MANFRYSDQHGMVMDEIPDDRGRLYVRVMPRAIAPQIILHEHDDVGYVEIHHAAARGDVPVLQRLLAAGHDKNAIQRCLDRPNVKWTLDDRIYRYITGATPLHLAAFFGHLDAVKALIEAGAVVHISAGVRAEPDVDRGYVTPLYLALQEGHHAVALLLYINGAQLIDPSTSGIHGPRGVSIIASTNVVGVSNEWPQFANTNAIAIETYSPMSVIEPDTLRDLMSTPQFSSWLKQYGNRNVFCKVAYACALSRVLSHHVQLAQHYNMDPTTDESAPIRRMLKILSVLADFDLIIPRLLLEPLGKHLVVAESYQCIGGSITRGMFMFTSMDLLFIFGGLAMFGVFPLPENQKALVRESVKAFANAETHNMRMDILKLIEALLTYLRLAVGRDADLVSEVKEHVDEQIKTTKEKAVQLRKAIWLNEPQVDADLVIASVVWENKQNLKMVKSKLRDLKLLLSVLVRSRDLFKSLLELAGQANLILRGSPQRFLSQQVSPLQLPPFACLHWSQTEPTRFYNARKEKSLTEARRDQIVTRHYHQMNFPAVPLFLQLQGLSQVPTVEDNFESDYSTDDEDNGSDMEEEVKEKLANGKLLSYPTGRDSNN